MRLFRYACAGLATSVLAASAFTGPAAAQAAGVGTSLTSTKVLTAQLGAAGSLLDLALLVDEARSTIDSAVAAPEAYTRLTALSAKASLVPTSPVNVTEGVFEAKSSGPTEVAIAGSTLAVPASVPAPLSPVLSGTIDPGKLTASLDQGVAASTMSSSVSSVKAIGGLVGVGSLKSVLDASSGASASSASRGASVNDITVLDLGALLNGLGLPLGELPLDTLSALLDELGLTGTLDLPTGADDLDAAVLLIDGLIEDVQGTVTVVGGEVTAVTGVVDSTVAGALTGIGVTSPLPTVTGTTQTVIDEAQAVLDALQALLIDLLTDALAALDGLALLRLEGVEVGVATKAVDTVAGSVATVTGKVGKVHVGGVELPGIDLAGTAQQVTTALAAVNTQLGEVLGTVHPDLANLVKVSVLDQATSITQEGGYTKSRAGITAATATITPPATLAAIVSGILGTADVAGLLAEVGGTLPQLDGVMTQLASTLNLTTSALAAPAKVQVASVLSASDYRLAAAPVTPGAPGSTPTLPRTGGADLVLFAGLLAVLALAIRRVTQHPEVKAVEVRR